MAVGELVALSFGGSGTNASSYATASLSPTAGRPVYIGVGSTKIGGTPDTPTIAGWTQIGTFLFDSEYRLTCFWNANPSGVQTIDFAGVNQTSCWWSICEAPGADDAVGFVAGSFKSATGTNSPASVALDDLASAGNAIVAATFIEIAAVITQRASWTELHDVAGTSPNTQLETQYRLGVNDDASAEWTGASLWGNVGFEIPEAAVALTPQPHVLGHLGSLSYV